MALCWKLKPTAAPGSTRPYGDPCLHGGTHLPPERPEKSGHSSKKQVGLMIRELPYFPVQTPGRPVEVPSSRVLTGCQLSLSYRVAKLGSHERELVIFRLLGLSYIHSCTLVCSFGKLPETRICELRSASPGMYFANDKCHRPR